MMFCAEFGGISRSGRRIKCSCAEFGCYFPLEMRKMMFPRGIWVLFPARDAENDVPAWNLG